MRVRIKLILAMSAVLAVSAGCGEMLDQKQESPVEQLSIEVPNGSTGTHMKRIQVNEELSRRLMSATPEEIKEIFGPAVKSVSPTFSIGGKWEKAQRESGLHLWFDVLEEGNVPETKATEVIKAVRGVQIVEDIPEIARDAMSDPRFSDQWNYLNDWSRSPYTPGIDIKLQEAWDIYGKYGNSSVIVAVVDGGVDFNHEDLAYNMWRNEAEINGADGVDDDGNGYVDDKFGYNFFDNSGTVTADFHGTHVAGTVAAVNNNGIGVCGVAGGKYPQQGARIMSCQIYKGEEPSIVSTPRVFQYAAENGAVICQNSWGYTSETARSITASDKAAVDYFIKNAGCNPDGTQSGPMKGGICIFSAGNSARDYGFPAGYEKCFAVASISPSGKAAYYSNYGEWVDVSAPGGDESIDPRSGGILSTTPGNAYDRAQGTSMACPHVSGLAALIVSEFGGPGFTCDDLWKILQECADPGIYQYNPSKIGQLGTGMISAKRAMALFSKTAPDPVAPYTVDVIGNKFTFNLETPADKDDKEAYFFNIYLDKKAYEFSVDSDEISIDELKFDSEYSVSVSASDLAGNESAKSAVKKIRTEKNYPPEIECPEKLPLSIQQWKTVTFFITASDPQGHDITTGYECDEPAAVKFVQVEKEKFRFDISGPSSTVGSHSITFKATDKYGMSSTLEIPYTIVENNPPVLTKPVEDQCISSKTGSVSLNADNYFNDPDGESLIYTFKSDADGVATASASGNSINVKAFGYGYAHITVTATDGAGKSVSSTFTVLVRDGSRPVDIYPNPVTDKVNIRTGQSTSAQVTIFSTAGKQVFDSTSEITPFKPLCVDMQQMTAGVYTIVVKAGSTETRNNVVKL